MNYREIYKKYKGYPANGGTGIKGIVCGYTKDSILMSPTNLIGWAYPENEDAPFFCEPSINGYWYISEYNIIGYQPFKFGK